MHPIPESIDHIENWVRMRDCLPNGWEHSNRIEYSAKIGKWCEDKIRYHRSRVKAIRNESIQEPHKGEEKWGQKRKEYCESNMCKWYMRKKHRYHEYDGTGYHTSDNSPSDKSRYDHPIWSWWYQYLFDSFLEFCHIKRWHYMGKWIHNNRHHNESWNNEFHIGESSHYSDSWSDELPKDHIIECRRDHWWDNCLFPYSEKSWDFFSDNSHIRNKQLRWRHISLENEVYENYRNINRICKR